MARERLLLAPAGAAQLGGHYEANIKAVVYP
jgi:hypothetical protein